MYVVSSLFYFIILCGISESAHQLLYRMHKLFLNLLVITNVISSCQRRVTNGSRIDPGADTSFVVYIVNKESGDTPGWICGGSIIHPALVLTSAACLELTGSKDIYVIAGYSKYVPSEDLETDECTKNLKNKIRSYCVHLDFKRSADTDTQDEKMYKWTKFDIAIARTFHPIDFYDNYYLKFCSYRPSSVGINFNSKYEDYGDAVVYGWGHDTYYRPEGDTNDYNQLELRYASSKVLPRVECEKYFENEYIKDRVGNSYMCTDGRTGHLDSKGVLMNPEEPFLEECGDSWRRRTGSKGNSSGCSSRRNSNESRSENTTIRFVNTRRNGICQNDHGSPLVIWIGGHPFAVGVASAFHVNKKMECVGPYLYTSVSCTSLFIHCVLREQTTFKARRIPSTCDSPKERGFFMKNVDIDWSKEDF